MLNDAAAAGSVPAPSGSRVSMRSAVDSSQHHPLKPHQRTQLWLEAMEVAGDAGRIITRSEFELLAR